MSIVVGEIYIMNVVCMPYAASAGAVVSSDTTMKSFGASGFLSTAHVVMQESPTGKHVLLVTIGRISGRDLLKMNKNCVTVILCTLHCAACVCSLLLYL